MKAKGKLLIIGGAEHKINDDRKPARYFEPFEILKELTPRCKNQIIEVITTGSMVPEVMRSLYHEAFVHIGYPDPGFLPIQDKMQARDPEFIERVKAAHVIFFTGGDQFRLSTILGGSKVIDIIKRRYEEDENFVVAGTSAGAMAMSSVMITDGGKQEVLIDADLKTSSGLSILHDCIVDTHFIKRGRFGRLAHAITINPDQLGIGLGEDAALVIREGSEAECRGSGTVVIIDGRYIRQTNVSRALPNEPIFVENLKVHLLVRGCRFSIRTRRLYKPAIAPRKGKHHE